MGGSREQQLVAQEEEELLSQVHSLPDRTGGGAEEATIQIHQTRTKEEEEETRVQIILHRTTIDGL